MIQNWEIIIEDEKMAELYINGTHWIIKKLSSNGFTWNSSRFPKKKYIIQCVFFISLGILTYSRWNDSWFPLKLYWQIGRILNQILFNEHNVHKYTWTFLQIFLYCSVWSVNSFLMEPKMEWISSYINYLAFMHTNHTNNSSEFYQKLHKSRKDSYNIFTLRRKKLTIQHSFVARIVCEWISSITYYWRFKISKVFETYCFDDVEN